VIASWTLDDFILQYCNLLYSTLCFPMFPIFFLICIANLLSSNHSSKNLSSYLSSILSNSYDRLRQLPLPSSLPMCFDAYLFPFVPLQRPAAISHNFHIIHHVPCSTGFLKTTSCFFCPNLMRRSPRSARRTPLVE
jgi:hypothetical protein